MKEFPSIDVTPAEYDQLRRLHLDCCGESISLAGMLNGYSYGKWFDGAMAILGDRFPLMGEAVTLNVVSEPE